MSQEIEPNGEAPIVNAFDSVRVMAFNEFGSVLVLRRAEGEQAGQWELPGGKKDNPNESPLATVVREYGEEVGPNKALILPDEIVYELPSRTFEHKGVFRTIFPKVMFGMTDLSTPQLDSNEHDRARLLYPHHINSNSGLFTVDAVAAAQLWIKNSGIRS